MDLFPRVGRRGTEPGLGRAPRPTTVKAIDRLRDADDGLAGGEPATLGPTPADRSDTVRSINVRSARLSTRLRYGPRAMGDALGYARVSKADQSVGLQIDALEAAGCIKVFTDQGCR